MGDTPETLGEKIAQWAKAMQGSQQAQAELAKQQLTGLTHNVQPQIQQTVQAFQKLAASVANSGTPHIHWTPQTTTTSEGQVALSVAGDIKWEAHKHPRLENGEFAPLGKGLFLLGHTKTATFQTPSGKAKTADLKPGESLHDVGSGLKAVHKPDGTWAHPTTGQAIPTPENPKIIEGNAATVIPAKSQKDAEAAYHSTVGVGDKITAAQAALLPINSKINFQGKTYKKLLEGDWYDPESGHKMTLLASDQATVASMPNKANKDQYAPANGTGAIQTKVDTDKKHIDKYASGVDPGLTDGSADNPLTTQDDTKTPETPAPAAEAPSTPAWEVGKKPDSVEQIAAAPIGSEVSDPSGVTFRKTGDNEWQALNSHTGELFSAKHPDDSFTAWTLSKLGGQEEPAPEAVVPPKKDLSTPEGLKAAVEAGELSPKKYDQMLADLNAQAEPETPETPETSGSGTTVMQLQGVGKHAAKKVSDLKVGDTVVFNYGSQATVSEVHPISPTMTSVTTTDKNGQSYTWQKKNTSLMGFLSPENQAKAQAVADTINAWQNPKPGDKVVNIGHLGHLPVGTVINDPVAGADLTKQDNGKWKWETGNTLSSSSELVNSLEGDESFTVKSVPGQTSETSPEAPAAPAAPKPEPVPVPGKKNKLTAYNEADAPDPGDGTVAPIAGKDYTAEQLVSSANGFVHPVSKEFFPLEKGDQVLQHKLTPESFAVMGADGSKKFQVNKLGKKYKWSPHIPKSNYKIIATAAQNSDNFDAGAEQLPDGTQYIKGSTFTHPASGLAFKIGEHDVLMQHNFTPNSYLVMGTDGQMKYKIDVKGKQQKAGTNLKPSNYHPIFDGSNPPKPEEPAAPTQLDFDPSVETVEVQLGLAEAQNGTVVPLHGPLEGAHATKTGDDLWQITYQNGHTLNNNPGSVVGTFAAASPVTADQLDGMAEGTKVHIDKPDGTSWEVTKGPDGKWASDNGKANFDGPSTELAIAITPGKSGLQIIDPPSSEPQPQQVGEQVHMASDLDHLSVGTHVEVQGVSGFSPDLHYVKHSDGTWKGEYQDGKDHSGEHFSAVPSISLFNFINDMDGTLKVAEASPADKTYTHPNASSPGLEDWEQQLLAQPVTTGAGEDLTGHAPIYAVFVPASYFFDAAPGTKLVTDSGGIAAVKQADGGWKTAPDYFGGQVVSSGAMAALQAGDEPWPAQYSANSGVAVKMTFPDQTHFTDTAQIKAKLPQAKPGSKLSWGSQEVTKGPDGMWHSPAGVAYTPSSLVPPGVSHSYTLDLHTDPSKIIGPAIQAQDFTNAAVGSSFHHATANIVFTKKANGMWAPDVPDIAEIDSASWGNMLSLMKPEAVYGSSLTITNPPDDLASGAPESLTQNSHGTPISNPTELGNWIQGHVPGTTFSYSSPLTGQKNTYTLTPDKYVQSSKGQKMPAVVFAGSVLNNEGKKSTFKVEAIPDTAVGKLAAKAADAKVTKTKKPKKDLPFSGGTVEPYSDFTTVYNSLDYYGLHGWSADQMGSEEFRNHVLNKLATARAARDDIDLNLSTAQKSKLTKAIKSWTQLAQANYLINQMDKGETLDTDVLAQLGTGAKKTTLNYKMENFLAQARDRAKNYAWEQSEPVKALKAQGLNPKNATHQQKIDWLKANVDGSNEWADYLSEYQSETVFLHYLKHPSYTSTYSANHYITAAKKVGFKQAFLNSAANADGTYSIAEESSNAPFPDKPEYFNESVWNAVKAALTGKLSLDSSDYDAFAAYKATAPGIVANGVPTQPGAAILKALDAVDSPASYKAMAYAHLLKAGVWSDGSKLTYADEFGEFPIPPGTKVYKGNHDSYTTATNLYFASPGVGDATIWSIYKPSEKKFYKSSYGIDPAQLELVYTGPETISYDDAVKDGQTFDKGAWDKVSALAGTVYNTDDGITGSDLIKIKKALIDTNSPAKPSELSPKARQLIKAYPAYADIIAYKDRQGQFRIADIATSTWADLSSQYANHPKAAFLTKIGDPTDYNQVKDQVSKVSDDDAAAAYTLLTGKTPSISNTPIQTKIALIKAIQQTNATAVSNQLTKPQPAPPATSGLLLPIPNKMLGGGMAKKYYVDADGNEYMAKPSTDKKFRADTEHAASVIARMYGFNMPESQVRDINGEYSHIQRLVEGATGDLEGRGPGDLTDSQLATVMSSHAMDWALSNHDTHGGNFLVDGNGNLVKIDVGQAWKALGADKLQVGWELPGNFGGVWYDKFYSQVQAGKIKKERLDATAQKVLAKAAQISNPATDSSYRSQLEFAFQNRTKFPNGMTKAQFIDKAMDRKASVLDDFHAFYTKLYKDGGYGDLPWAKDSFKTSTTPGSDAGHYTVSTKLVEDAHTHGAHGHALFFGGQDVEDSHALIYTSKAGSHTNMWADLKVRAQADKQVLAFINKNSNGLAVDPDPDSGVTGYGPIDTIGATSALVNFAKTVSHHSADGEYNQSHVSQATMAKQTLQAQIEALHKKFATDPAFVAKGSQGLPSFATGHQQQAWLDWANQMVQNFTTTEQAMAAGQKSPKWDSSLPTYTAPKDVDTSGKPKPVETIDLLGKTYTKYSDYNYVGEAGPISEAAWNALAGMSDAKHTHLETKTESVAVTNVPSFKIKQVKFSTIKGSSSTTGDGTPIVTENGKQSFGPTAYEIRSDAFPGITIQYLPHANASHGGDETNQGRVQVKIENSSADDPSRLNDALQMMSHMGIDTTPADDQSMELFYWRQMLNTMQDRKHDQGNSGVKATIKHMKDAYASGAADSPASEIAALKEAFAKQWGQSVVDQADWTPKFGAIDQDGTQGGRPFWMRPDFDVKAYRKNVGQLPSRSMLSSHGDTYNSAIRPFEGGGFLSNEERPRFIGKFGEYGISTSEDRSGGGSQVIYLRQGQHPTSSAQYFEPEVVGRTTTYTQDHDTFGRTSDKLSYAPWTMEGIYSNAGSGYGNSSNETMVKYGASVWDHLAVTIVDSSTRNKMLKWFKDHGITEIRGLPVEERVVDNSTDLDKTIEKVWAMAEARQKHNQEVAKGGGVGHGIGG